MIRINLSHRGDPDFADVTIRYRPFLHHTTEAWMATVDDRLSVVGYGHTMQQALDDLGAKIRRTLTI